MGGVTWKQTAAYQRWASWTRPALREGLCACDWSHSLLVPSHSLMWWHWEKAYERCCSWLNYSLCDVLSNQPPANSVWEWECVTANLVSTEITWLSEVGTEMYITLPPSKAPISSLKAAARKAADPPQWSGPMWWHQRPTGTVSEPHRVPLMVPNSYNAKWKKFLCDRPQLFSQSSNFTICAIAFILAALCFRKPWNGNLVSNTTEENMCDVTKGSFLSKLYKNQDVLGIKPTKLWHCQRKVKQNIVNRTDPHWDSAELCFYATSRKLDANITFGRQSCHFGPDDSTISNITSCWTSWTF